MGKGATMIHIFTSVVNRPDFLEYQLQSLNKFVKDDFTFHAVYDLSLIHI